MLCHEGVREIVEKGEEDEALKIVREKFGNEIAGMCGVVLCCVVFMLCCVVLCCICVVFILRCIVLCCVNVVFYVVLCGVVTFSTVETLRRARALGRESDLLASIISTTAPVHNTTQHNTTAPASSFLTITSIHLHLAQLKHLMEQDSQHNTTQQNTTQHNTTLLESTCESMLNLLEAMPIGGLSVLNQWEGVVLCCVAETLLQVKQNTIRYNDLASMLSLSIAIQCGDLQQLLDVLQLMLGITQHNTTGDVVLSREVKVPVQLQRLLRRLLCCVVLDDVLDVSVLLNNPIRTVHIQSDNNDIVHPTEHVKLPLPPPPPPPRNNTTQTQHNTIHYPTADGRTQHNTTVSTIVRRSALLNTGRLLEVGDRVVAIDTIQHNTTLGPGEIGIVVQVEPREKAYRVQGN